MCCYCDECALLIVIPCLCVFLVFFFNDTATTEIYTLSLHDALPICPFLVAAAPRFLYCPVLVAAAPPLFLLTISGCGSAPSFYPAHFSLRQRPRFLRSEEHTSELQSHSDLVCRLLLEKKKKTDSITHAQHYNT